MMQMNMYIILIIKCNLLYKKMPNHKNNKYMIELSKNNQNNIN